MSDTNKFTLKIELPTRETPENETGGTEIEVTTYGSWYNDGIGAYEYWGCKGVDKGEDYFTIDATKWNQTGFTKEEIKLVEAEIETKCEEWSNTVEKEAKDSHGVP